MFHVRLYPRYNNINPWRRISGFREKKTNCPASTLRKIVEGLSCFTGLVGLVWSLSLDSVFGCSKLGVDLDPIVNIIINILGGGRKCDNQNYFYNIERKIGELIIPPSTAFLGDLNA